MLQAHSRAKLRVNVSTRMRKSSALKPKRPRSRIQLHAALIDTTIPIARGTNGNDAIMNGNRGAKFPIVIVRIGRNGGLPTPQR